MIINNFEFAKSEKHRHLFMEDGFAHVVFLILNNLVHPFSFFFDTLMFNMLQELFDPSISKWNAKQTPNIILAVTLQFPIL